MVFLLQHVGFETDCRRLKAGVERVLKAGKVRDIFDDNPNLNSTDFPILTKHVFDNMLTRYDLIIFQQIGSPNFDTQVRTRDLGGYASTREFTQAIISAIR